MSQQPRYPPRTASPANSPQTNPTRTNNSRDAHAAASRARTSAASEMSAVDGPDALGASGPSRESVKKLDQIIQNFHTKAAVIILQSRLATTTSRRTEGRRTNKWFQIETEEIDDFREELRIWRTCGGFENRPPPMVIETYLDASCLTPSQSLVVTDKNGETHDVLDALNSSDSSSDGSSSSKSRRRNTEVILERWTIDLRPLPGVDLDDFGPTLPTIYKRSIVFFRSLFVTTRIIPAWKAAQQQAAARSVHSALEVRCRFAFKDRDTGGFDLLRQPLSPSFDGRYAVTDYMFGDLEVPVGRFYASVTYRNECNFRVDDTEAMASSRFMGVDDQLFQPSLPQRLSGRRDSYTDVSSRRYERKQPEQQTYGSLSTFHGAGPLGTSPLSALKAVRPAGSDTSSPPGSLPASVEPDPPHSLPIAGHSSFTRPALRGADGLARRTSVSFQPFKAGSLSGSPRIHDGEVPPSPSSLARQSALGAFQAARNRSSLTAGMAASLRGGPPSDVTGSASPRPTSRYSSSFTHRRGRLSFGGASKAGDDDQGSSGKHSLSSSMQPGSGLLAEAAGASSGSVQTDDENISEFLKILDSKKTLQSFELSSKTGEAATKRTVAQLSKFQLMRESNNALTESMTSSMQLPPSSGSSSRHLASMLQPSSISPSGSPKPLSPHAPHTPAVPSRLSENAIIDHPVVAQRSGTGAAGSSDANVNSARQEGTTAIDIPLSPRLLQTKHHRSSSVALQNRVVLDEDDAAVPDLPFAGNRSLSLGADSGEPPARLTGLGLTRVPGDSDPLRPAAEIRGSLAAARSSSMSTDADEKVPSPALITGGASGSYRSRFVGSAGRGQPSRPTPPQSSRGSFSGSGGGRYGGGSRVAGDSAEADEEPFIFTMSELEREHRNSIEEGQGGAESSGSGRTPGDGTGSSESRGTRYESRGISRRIW